MALVFQHPCHVDRSVSLDSFLFTRLDDDSPAVALRSGSSIRKKDEVWSDDGQSGQSMCLSSRTRTGETLIVLRIESRNLHRRSMRLHTV